MDSKSEIDNPRVQSHFVRLQPGESLLESLYRGLKSWVVELSSLSA
jgi:hypothetical protein